MKQSVKVLTMLVALALMFAVFAAPASAGDVPPPPNGDVCKMFYLGAVHGINGERLGLPRELPVDVYVNGAYAFTFEFKDTFQAMLPAGEYLITVNLAGTQTEVMRLGPVEIPGCVKVLVQAKLVDGVPTLVPRIRELYPPK